LLSSSLLLLLNRLPWAEQHPAEPVHPDKQHHREPDPRCANHGRPPHLAERGSHTRARLTPIMHIWTQISKLNPTRLSGFRSGWRCVVGTPTDLNEPGDNRGDCAGREKGGSEAALVDDLGRGGQVA